MGIMRTKSVEQSIRDTEDPEFKLHKALDPLDLTVFGIGVIIGTGLFVLTGEAAALYSGPAIALSYVVAGVACTLAALCYAEFASSVPVAGQNAPGSLRADRGSPDLPVRDGLPDDRYLAEVPGLDGPGAHHLLRLQQEPQPPSPGGFLSRLGLLEARLTAFSARGGIRS